MSGMFDTVIEGADVVTADGIRRMDVAIDGGNTSQRSYTPAADPPRGAASTPVDYTYCPDYRYPRPPARSRQTRQGDLHERNGSRRRGRRDHGVRDAHIRAARQHRRALAKSCD